MCVKMLLSVAWVFGFGSCDLNSLAFPVHSSNLVVLLVGFRIKTCHTKFVDNEVPGQLFSRCFCCCALTCVTLRMKSFHCYLI